MLMLNPCWRMRNEKRRILLYKLDTPDGVTVEQFSSIHPLHAILLSLFDGNTNKAQITKDFSYVTNLSAKDGTAKVKALLEEINKIDKGILIPFSPQEKITSRYNPEDFVISIDKIQVDSNPRLENPLQLGFDLTNKCEKKCIYCYAETGFSQSGELLHLEQVKEILDEAKRMGIVGIPFGGGDPFARDDIVQILEHSNKINLNYMISTKQYLSQELCAQLKDCGVTKIQISIDSMNPAIADRMTGSINFLSNTLRTIHNLQAVNISVTCKAVITSINIEGALDLCQGLTQRGVKTIKLTGYGRSIYRHSESLFASKVQLDQLSEEVSLFKKNNPGVDVSLGGIDTESSSNLKSFKDRRVQYQNRNVCVAGRQSMHILPDGKVTLCEQLPSTPEFIVGDLKKQSLSEIWRSESLNYWINPSDNLFKGTICDNCPDLVDCNTGSGRCFRNSYSVYGSPWAPVPNCPYTDDFVRMS